MSSYLFSLTVWNEVFSQLFQQAHKELRAKERDWQKVRKKTGLKIDSYVDPVMLDVDQPGRVGSSPAIPSEVPAPSDITECSNFKNMLRISVTSKVPFLHKRRFLEVPPSNHLAWLLRWQRQDITSSRLYLKRLTLRHSSYPVLRYLPLPFRYVRP